MEKKIPDEVIFTASGTNSANLANAYLLALFKHVRDLTAILMFLVSVFD